MTLAEIKERYSFNKTHDVPRSQRGTCEVCWEGPSDGMIDGVPVCEDSACKDTVWNRILKESR